MSQKRIYLLLVCLSISLSGCMLVGKQDAKANTIQDQLINMEGYACLASLSHIENGKTNTYETKQVYQMDGKYRVEVTKPENIAGLTTICDGKKTYQYNPKLDKSFAQELNDNNFRNQLFLGSFVKNYLQSEDVSIEVQNMDPGLTTVLEAVIPGGSPHMYMQRVWLDQKTYKPLRMAIYNQDNEKTVLIEFIEFTYNPEIDQSIFIFK